MTPETRHPPGPTPGGSRGGERPLSALPSVQARVLAFAAILVAGICGGLIGSGFVGVQCKGQCTTPQGIGALIGGALAAGGVAVVAVLTLRAMGEWKTIREQQAAEHAATDEAAGAAATGDERPGDTNP